MTTLSSPPHGLQAYIVGGYVRDKLLGKTPKDRDWVVVGSTPEQMRRLGFQQVGKDFPVFLHPQTKEEYALARTERKTGRGYKGFQFDASPHIRLEDDLKRRDLTINAMALDSQGQLIDPLGGRYDLQRRVLRHASPAFVDDPLRVLRVARFAAQLNFDIAPQTLALCQKIARSGELDSLVPERIWQELQRALSCPAPQRFIESLRMCHALAPLFPEIDALFGVPQPRRHHPEIDTGQHVLLALEQAARLSDVPQVRFATLLHDVGKAATPPEHWPRHRGHEVLGVPLVDRFCKRYRVPKHYHRLARKTTRHHLSVHIAFHLKPKTLLKLFEELDAFRARDDFEHFLLACMADARGRKGQADKPYPQADFLRHIHAAISHLSYRDLPDPTRLQGREIAKALRHLRIQRIAQIKREYKATRSRAENPPKC